MNKFEYALSAPNIIRLSEGKLSEIWSVLAYQPLSVQQYAQYYAAGSL